MVISTFARKMMQKYAKKTRESSYITKKMGLR